MTEGSSEHTRRNMLAASAAAGAVLLLTGPSNAQPIASVASGAIRPFRINVP